MNRIWQLLGMSNIICFYCKVQIYMLIGHRESVSKESLKALGWSVCNPIQTMLYITTDFQSM